MALVYLASPFFNNRELQQVKTIKRILESNGHEVYSPKDDAGVLMPDSSKSDRRNVLAANVGALTVCDWVVCNTERKDVGSIWEAGAAYILGKPVVYFAENLPGSFNVMLGESGFAVCEGFVDLNRYIASIGRGGTPYMRREYEGKIE